MVVRNNAVQIPISQEMKQRAKEFAERATTETYDRFTYEWKQRVEKVYVGKLGEEILRQYFLEQGIEVAEIDYNVYEGTTAIDETDLQAGSYSVDVKVGTQNFHKRLLVVKRYFDNRHQSDYYVAINLYDNETIAVIYGYATKNEIANARTGSFDKVNPVPDYYLFYDNLRPIEELVEILQEE